MKMLMSCAVIGANLFVVGTGIVGVYAGVGVMYMALAGGYVYRFCRDV